MKNALSSTISNNEPSQNKYGVDSIDGLFSGLNLIIDRNQIKNIYPETQLINKNLLKET